MVVRCNSLVNVNSGLKQKIMEKRQRLLESKYDPMGAAISDYWENGKAATLRVFSPMFEEDEMPVETLFRDYEEMPILERKALDLAHGRTLDVGAGAGCHSLVLQQRNIDVYAIDISPLSVETMKKRGVFHAGQQDLFSVKEKFDTILMLMNGIGIVGTCARLPLFFHLLDNILLPGGQLLCDSSDISYVFDDDESKEDSINYYGEMVYTMQYKDILGRSFPWLYIDSSSLNEAALSCGYQMDIVMEGDHYDYLARITKKD